MDKVELDTLAKLLPCPFCGERVSLVVRDKLFVFRCPEHSPCIGSGFATYGKLDQMSTAIAAWNTRDNLPAIREQADEIERLREFAKSVADLSDTGCDFIDGVLLRTSARAALNPQKENSRG